MVYPFPVYSRVAIFVFRIPFHCLKWTPHCAGGAELPCDETGTGPTLAERVAKGVAQVEEALVIAVLPIIHRTCQTSEQRMIHLDEKGFKAGEIPVRLFFPDLTHLELKRFNILRLPLNTQIDFGQ